MTIQTVSLQYIVNSTDKKIVLGSTSFLPQEAFLCMSAALLNELPKLLTLTEDQI